MWYFDVVRHIDEVVDEGISSRTLILDSDKDEKIFWIDVKGKKTSRDESSDLFDFYNLQLKLRLDKLRAFDRGQMTTIEISSYLELNHDQVYYYLRRIRPDLRANNDWVVPSENVYPLLVDFMPIIEGWETTTQLKDELKIARDTITTRCKKGLVEARWMFNRWHISPIGKMQLKEQLGLDYNIDNPGAGYLTLDESAKELGKSSSTVSEHYRNGHIVGEGIRTNLRFSRQERNRLRPRLRYTGALELDGKTYYPVPDVATEAAEKRGHTDQKTIYSFGRRFRILLKKHKDEFDYIRMGITFCVDEETRKKLIDLMRLYKAMGELGLGKEQIYTLKRHDVLRSYSIGSRSWISYRSVQKYKAAQTK